MKEFFTDATSARNFAQKAKVVPSQFNGTTVHTWVGKKLMRVRNAAATIMMMTHRTMHLNYHANIMVVMFLCSYVFLVFLALLILMMFIMLLQFHMSLVKLFSLTILMILMLLMNSETTKRFSRHMTTG